MIHLLAIDATAVIIAGITGVVSLGSLVITLLINKNVKVYRKEVDGMKTELVAAVKGKGEAEGELKGRAAVAAETVQPVTDPLPVTEKGAEKVATTVVEKIKADPDIEVKKRE